MTEKTLRGEIEALAKAWEKEAEVMADFNPRGEWNHGTHTRIEECREKAAALRSLLARHPEPARALAAPEEWAERALAWLKEQEWSAWRSSDGGREDFVGAECCPECSGMKAEDHYVGCAIDALLNSAPAPRTPAATPPKEDRHG
jgi:hypothetical protein